MTTGTLARWGIFAAFAALPALAARVDPHGYEGGSRNDRDAIERRNESAIGKMLGEVRTTMADMMFVKTELYLHNGVAYAAHLDMDAMQSTGEIAAKPDADRIATMIPDAPNDFRGIVGELERRVKPWHGPDVPDVHSSATELLPWYRVMTVSDPHNVRAYLVGGWWLKGAKPEEGLKFAEEGIASNPKAFQLRYMKGQILLELARRARESGADDAAARELSREAFQSFLQAADLAVEQRPADYDPDGSDMPTWSHYTEEDARGSARMAVFMARDMRPTAEAVAMAERYSAGFGGDGVLDRTAKALRAKLEKGEADVP